MKKTLLLPLSFLALSGCVQNIDRHGHLVEPDDLESLTVGRSTKQDVARQIGSPSSVSTFHDNQWYYIAETRARVLFFTPDTLDSQVTVIHFDPHGYYAGAEYRGLDDAEAIKHVGRETPTAGHSFGFFEQMFGNVGRFGNVDPDAPSRGE